MQDLCAQIRAHLTVAGERLDDVINVKGIADTIYERYGLVDIATIDASEYWAIVQEHDSSRH